MIISYVFLPHLFSLETSNYLRLNRKTIYQVYLLQVQYFSQLEHVNTRSSKLESQFYHFPSSSYAFYNIENNLKALIQLHLILQEKHLKQQVSYFLSNSTLYDESNKIWFTQLDTPSSRYEFLKHIFKYMKKIRKIKEHTD